MAGTISASSAKLKHLLVDISAHGYGHLAQTAPVVNVLARKLSGLRVTVRSAAPLHLLQQRFQCDFMHIPVELDFGMCMHDAVEVDVVRSLAAYRRYHADWQDQVAREAAVMRGLNADLLLANVPYRSLAAARQIGLPSVGMCCLNWADIYRHYAGDTAEARRIHAEMLDAYNAADGFLKVQPTMPMSDLAHAQTISPIAQTARRCRDALIKAANVPENDRLVLIGMGGIHYRLEMEHWPQIEGVRWIVPGRWGVARGDILAFETLGMPFGEVLASCDAVLTKPGYGTFVEAACAGVPVLYVSRGDWPEQPWLLSWLNEYGVAREVSESALQNGDLAGELHALWGMAAPYRPVAEGAEQAAARLLMML